MSGGQLVVLDRLGRDVKSFPLEHGLVTLGSDHSCDIRFMLDTVSPHHATVAVHANQTVVRNVCGGETLVNGRCVSVAALRHGDVIGVGGRALRWDYADPAARRPQQAMPALCVARRTGARGARRGSAGGAGGARRDRALQLALEMSHRASMPANAGGKQVAIVQPQRRDTNDQNDKSSPRTLQSNKRRSKNELDISMSDSEVDSKRKSNARASIKSPVSLQNTTKATLWIESRKSSPRQSAKLPSPRKSAVQSPQYVVNARRTTVSAKKSTPLRLAVLKRAQSAQKVKVTKIEEPLKIDHTKQAAILLMTGHTPKTRLLGQKTPIPKTTPNSTTPKSVTPKTVTPKSGGRRSASFVVKKKSPVRKSSPRGRKSRSSAASTPAAQDRTVTILEITDSDARNSTLRSSSRRNTRSTLEKSPLLPSPKKSALKNPLAKKSMRKTESIKFDLSNLENHSKSDVLMVTNTTGQSADSVTEDELTLHYETSSVQSPSPRRSIHSRSSKMLHKSLGTTLNVSSPSRTLTPASPRPRKSLRGSVILQKALNGSNEKTSPTRRGTKSATTTLNSTNASPYSPRNTMESYSIVDLVSIDSNESGRSTSVYNSASANTTAFGTPQTTARKTRSTINPILVDSSTPYVRATRSSSSNPPSRSTSSGSRNRSSVSSRKTKSVSTPENSIKSASVSMRVSRASRSRSRINDSDLMVVESEADDSPRSSKRTSTTSKRSSSAPQLSYASNNMTSDSPTENEGTSTPENRHSPEEASTPVLSIQSLLDSSQSSIRSRSARRGRPSLKRKTIGVLSRPKTRISAKSKSMNFSARQTRLRLSNDSYENMNVSVQSEGEIVTPKSAVKLVQEAVKNKHSTAKKPQSKRSIIDDLNESDIVKQLFNSPVKRKLSQSMTEFSRRQLLEDDEVQVRRPTRNTVALSGRTPDQSLMEHSQAYTPERFVSPISTPSHSPNLTGIKLMFAKTTPENDLRNVRGVKAILRTPRARKSIKNDLTDVAGVKVMFARSPRNRLSNVRVKEVFASSPKNDLTRVSGVKSLFRSQQERRSPRNSLSDVRGVKKLFTKKSPANDLRNVSGVKRTLQRNTPKNDLSDVRGVKRMFRRDKRNELNDLSGVEELFNESNQSHRDTDSLFDQLIGKPTIKAVYSKTLNPKSVKKNKRKTKSLHVSLDVIANNVEEWLEQELQKRLQANRSKANVTRELQKLATDTVEGTVPIRTSRIRNSSIVRTSTADGSKRMKSASELYSAHTLPIKKRSLVDASLEKTKNDTKPVHLPIKKRVVVHSTPVKGRVNVTMNASELGRVSPIVADKTQDLDHDVPKPNRSKAPVEARSRSRRNTKAPPSPKLINKSPRKTRGKSILPTKAAPATLTKDKSPAQSKTPSPAKKTMVSKAKSVLKSKKSSPVKKPASPAAKSPTKPPSPKTKPSSPAKPPTPVAKAPSPKATRSRKIVAASPKVETKARKRGATLVVAKKTPVMSPVPRASRKRTEATLPTPTATPKRTRGTRKIVEKVAEKPKTPQNTRAKVQKATVVVVKPSPQLKPRATRAKAQTDISKAKKTVEKKVKSPKKSPVKKAVKEVTVPKTRGRKATNDISKQSDVVKAQPKTKRGRNTTAEEPVVARKTRRTGKQEPIEDEPKKGEKVAKTEETKKTRGKKLVAQESVQSEPTTRSRRGAKLDNTAPEINTRKRKTTASDDRPAKVSKSKEKEEIPTRRRNKKEEKEEVQTLKTRGRNKKVDSPKAETVNKKAAKQNKEKAGDVKRTTRAKKAEVSVEMPNDKKPTRGRKVAVVESAPVVGKRKRKTAAESSVEQASKKARGGSKAAPTRARASGPAEASKPGRSRRR